MEQQLDRNFPKNCLVAQENLEETNKMVLEAVEVICEQAKYTGSENAVKAAETLRAHVEEALVPSNKETAEFYGKTAEELNKLFAVLG